MQYLLNELPLGIDGLKILLHLANLLVLVIVLSLLVYKPVKKFMENRRNAIEGQLAENEKNRTEVEALREEYNGKLTAAQREAEEIAAKKLKESEQAGAKIIAAAQSEAEALLLAGKQKAEREKAEAIDQLKNEVADIAVDMASGILEREISKADNDKLIEDCLKEWENKKND